jgi:hypothetical protein
MQESEYSIKKRDLSLTVLEAKKPKMKDLLARSPHDKRQKGKRPGKREKRRKGQKTHSCIWISLLQDFITF